MGVHHLILFLPIPLPAPGIPSAGRQVIIGRRGSGLGPDLRRQCLAAPRGPKEYIRFSTHDLVEIPVGCPVLLTQCSRYQELGYPSKDVPVSGEGGER